ncbi:hypothetical protein A0J48_002680 [Sphaerospermopsis aphanizomenoides BCCUSP55]|uniref:hypothetical protein n=1 Tax=Sphaerospermopsis aphanizomenoides TaxID=459663 RepID=UPI000AD3F1B5|nr:hypothetical protein [Sphaerospermopsis aphanizomenoides]MBK1986462.1 hypothetical protein [Sphaerospermopsis aphanizomenoides BCCUSP55]
MNKFFRLSSWFAIAGLTWSVGYFYNARYGGELSWVRMLYEQKMAIAKEVQAPRRILVVGGSGAHYTVDAKLMQEKLGIPTINIATDGPIGLDVILPSVSDVIKKGDIVLLIPEYLLLLDDDGFGDRSGQFGAAIGKPGLGNVPPKQLAQDLMLLGIPTLKAATKSSLDVIEKGRLTGYYSDPVTANGDPTVMKKRTKSKWWSLTINNSVSPHSLRRIQQFKQEVEAKGATLVLGLSWIYGSTDPLTLGNIRKTAEELEKIAPVLYDKESLNVKTDSSLFADTHYHLNPNGRRTRTSELVEQFKAANIK